VPPSHQLATDNRAQPEASICCPVTRRKSSESTAAITAPTSVASPRVLSLAGNDRDTSHSIETSDAAAKKLGDQFFEKLAAVFGPTPKLAVLPRPPTNQRGVVRAAFVVAVLLYVSRYSFGN
jgi:hypothetical protein